MSDHAGPGPSRRVFLTSRELGCPINLALTTRLHNYLVENGWAFTQPEAADYLVFVSCSSLPEMRRSVADAVAHFARHYPEKKIVVSCCYVKEDMVDAPNVVYIPLARHEQFDAWFDAAVPLRQVASGATLEDASEVGALPDPRAVLNRPYNVMVAAGCLNHCAFCVGKSVFPTVQSVPLADVVAECRAGLRRGYNHFVIGASDVSAYGHDLGHDVADLFAALFAEVVPARPDLVLGFKGFEPSGFLRHFDRLKPYFASGRVGWLCLPIQSGSDRVLRAMNRKYRVADVVDAIAELRRLAPALRVETDVIYCYPTETAADFEASVRLLTHFDHVQMLAFQRHENTRAATLTDVFDDTERERRRQVVAALQAHEHDRQRPECRPRIDIELSSPLGGSGFGVLKEPE